jgi:hypothetical protein
LLDASNLLVIGSVSGFFMIGVVLIVEKRKLI